MNYTHNDRFNSITTLEDANMYLNNMYSLQAVLEPVKKKFRFVNVPPMERYPCNSFKSVQKAMNCLFYHELGLVRRKREAKEVCVS